MPRPWTILDRVDTPEGPLELCQRGPKDFVIAVAGRVLMSSTAVRTERAVAEAACRRVTTFPAPRVLIGGLGMAFTLRAALDSLPKSAQVTVVEMNPVVERWCRGPLAEMTGHPLDDPRTTLVIGDVAKAIAATRAPALWHAIVLDLYEGPHDATQDLDDPFYGPRALALSRRALMPGGVLAVWSEDPDKAFEERLATAGFKTERVPPPPSGPKHVVYLAKVPGAVAAGAPASGGKPGSKPGARSGGRPGSGSKPGGSKSGGKR
jgi:spermidine synthase